VVDRITGCKKENPKQKMATTKKLPDKTEAAHWQDVSTGIQTRILIIAGRLSAGILRKY
jgi:hypothetical protein